MHNASALFSQLASAIAEIYSEEEALQIARLIFSDKLGISRIALATEADIQVEDAQFDFVMDAIGKLLKGMPVQQVIGFTEFYGIRLRINKHVLIPRPETEELVDWIIKENKDETGEVLDIGTGSGCIAIALGLHMPKANVTGLEKSQQALELAQINRIGANAPIALANFDILKREFWKRLDMYNIIVSNPPYVRESEKDFMHQNVLNYEPHMALFVPDNNALLFYDSISDFGLKHLHEGGKLYFEINEALGPDVVAMLEKKGYTNVMLKQDLYGKDRFIKAVLN